MKLIGLRSVEKLKIHSYLPRDRPAKSFYYLANMFLDLKPSALSVIN